MESLILLITFIIIINISFTVADYLFGNNYIFKWFGAIILTFIMSALAILIITTT